MAINIPDTQHCFQDWYLLFRNKSIMNILKKFQIPSTCFKEPLQPAPGEVE